MDNLIKRVILFIFFLSVIFSCSDQSGQLFNILTNERTGINFNNRIFEDEYFNILSNEYIYNGAGVGVGDFNRDGQWDIFFSGGMVSNKLFLNQGDLRFEDVTMEAGVDAEDFWCTGVSIVDINLDGWDDIYVCASHNEDPLMRKNKFFIHQGLNENNNPFFIDQAEKYGIADDGHSTHGVFFDFDNDHDLDLYVLTNFLETTTPNSYRERKVDGTAPNNDRFYVNDGDGTFENKTWETGIRYEGYGLGISIVDFNLDGWSDIYISNDYLTNDLLYINNRDGTFTNQIRKYIKHQTHSAMGHNIADINNDGLSDIFTLDMLPASNQLLKQMHGTSRFENNELNDKYGYEYQYKRNMLQINNGEDVSGNHNFSEIGLFAGIYATDWSWSALIADFDNDGHRDLFISNGYPKDVTDLDYATSGVNRGMTFSQEEILMVIPIRHPSNYIFKNNGDLTFTDYTKQWGIDIPSFSNGGTYVDIDNDGDLDLIVSNINEPAMLYENRLINKKSKIQGFNYLRMQLIGSEQMPNTLGSKVFAYYCDGRMLYEDYSLYHGFSSSREPVIHFGLGSCVLVDSVYIIWPDNKKTVIYNIPANQELKITYQNTKLLSQEINFTGTQNKSKSLFSESAARYNLLHKHQEESFDDFKIQPSIPHQYSQAGPSLAVGDMDGNGQLDLYIGGAAGQNGHIFLQKNQSFEAETFIKRNPDKEDLGSLLFDADGDGDLDLYIVFGGYEYPVGSEAYEDELYINDGRGNYTFLGNVLPPMKISSSCVKAADFDKDGDLDLFVGGKVSPGRYPEPVRSFILQNDSYNNQLKFTDVTEKVCPEMLELGMVTDALWTDMDNDETLDLIIVGEWMPISVYKNLGNKLINISETTGLQTLKGWWNSICGGDFDNDGDIDYVAGNLGLNSIFKASLEKPVKAYSADFDNNGRFDVIITSYYLDKNGGLKEYPIHFRSDLFRQMDILRSRFNTYEAYSEATIDSILTSEELKLARIDEASCFESLFIENLGGGKFNFKPLPREAQFAPLFGMLPGDYNQDDNLDLLIVGNDYSNNAFWGRYDALNGLLLEGQGKGDFVVKNYTETGFLVDGDAKSLICLPMANQSILIIATQNQDSMRVFETKVTSRIHMVGNSDLWAKIELSNGKIRKQEFYYGHSYLSQSARFISLPVNTSNFQKFNFSGQDTVKTSIK